MKDIYTSTSRRQRPVAWLYLVVFGSKFSLLFTVVLLLSFFVQPFNQAFAQETVEPESTTVPAESVAMQVAEDDVDTTALVETSPVEETTPSVSSETETSDDQQSSSEGEADSTDSDNSDTTDVSTETEAVDIASTTQEEASSSDSTVIDEAALSEAEIDAAETGAAVTPYVISNDNFYQFSKQACVLVGNGTYHCSNTTVGDVSNDDVVFADFGPEGNKEIYIKTKRGQVEQLTSNAYEDIAPQYDVGTSQIVWQRDIDGRYQIILYNLETRSETQLTFSRTNNMEPAISASGVVWQAWDGNDWEIMFHDGNFTEQLTDNDVQDIGPIIQDGYILWSVPSQNTQEARVYSLQSKEISLIASTEGGQITNPRFVLVYDTQFENGDIITQSFDPTTGEAGTIAAQPAPEPIDIPQPDPVGEIRALIQNKSTDESDDVVTETDSPNPNLNLLPATTTGTSTNAPALIIPDDSNISTATSVESVDFELTEFDLVITNEAVSTTSATSTQ